MHVKVTDGAVEAFPYGLRELMRDNPNTSFPEGVGDEFLVQYGIYPVTPAEIPQPFDNVNQNCAVANPVLVDGTWTQSWLITEASDAEKAQRLGDLAQNARANRDNLLQMSDWTQVADTPVDKAPWAAYRQELRDITTQSGFPRTIVWPVSP
jgi:hypothetical protein